MTNPNHQLADALRDVTAAMQQAIDEGFRSRMIDADDLVEVLLSVADRLDPPLPATPVTRLFYVATRSRYVLVAADSESAAMVQGTAALADLAESSRTGVPVEIQVVRPATPEEIQLDAWHRQETARSGRGTNP